ncbi:MAG: 2-oxoacid:acceptor oxidoreductase family protein [Planctomycetota bacterium]|jgi:2-oxoglutarate ferredoxin oxidoreductase subunit gamma
MEERMIFAGAGGQGLMTLGKLLALAAMNEGFNVTWYPSYGAEVRGGTAHCHVVISDDEIISPLVEEASVLMIMNRPSLSRFSPRLSDGGLLVLNTSLVERPEELSGTVLAVEATDIANNLRDIRVANAAMLGALNESRRFVSDDAVKRAFEELLPGKQAVIDVNLRAYEEGRKAAR